MSRKHNQYRNRITRERGSAGQDLDDKNAVAAALPEYMCVYDYYLVGWDSGEWRIVNEISKSWLARYKPLIIRHPDIVAYRAGINIIIEIDGAVHRGDHKRNSDYQVLGVPYVVLNKADIAEACSTLTREARHKVETEYRRQTEKE